jgi:polar amino acid transport system substrate-binding protein
VYGQEVLKNMMKHIRGQKMWIGLIFMVSLLAFSGCAGTGKGKTAATPAAAEVNSLRIGVAPSAPPLVFYQEERVAGIEADFANALAQSLGKTPRFVVLAWDDLIPALLEKRIDIIMSGMSITRLRETRINFTAPYLRAGQMALVRNQDVSSYPSASAIKNTERRVGFMKGTTGDFLVQKEFQLTTRKIPYTMTKDAVQALIEERIDMVIGDAPVIWWNATAKEPQGLMLIPIFLTEENLAWGVRKDDTALLESANRFLETWKSSGKLKSTIKQWIPSAPAERIP